MGASVSSRAWAATLPNAQTTRGWMAAKLPLEKRQAVADLFGLRIAVAGRTALDDIADINHLPGQIHGGNDFGQQLSGRAHKRPAALVLIEPGTFAHEYQSGVRVAFTEHDMGSRMTQRAAGTIAQVGADICQRFFPGRPSNVPPPAAQAFSALREQSNPVHPFCLRQTQ
jgi:hypothetical protein